MLKSLMYEAVFAATLVAPASLAARDIPDATSPQAQPTPGAPPADEPGAGASSAHQSQVASWPPDKQAQFKSWPQDYQDYFWTLTPTQQQAFWSLTDQQRGQIVKMSPDQQAQVWQSIEAQLRGQVPPQTAPDAGPPSPPSPHR